MDSFCEPLYSKVHALAVGLLEGTLSVEERLEFENLLLENPAARQAYLDYMQESACMRWLCGEEFPSVIELASETRIPMRRERTWRRIAVAVFGGALACALVAFAANLWYFRNHKTIARPVEPAIAITDSANAPLGADVPQMNGTNANHIGRPAVATITALGAVRWQSGSDARQILSRCAIGERLRLREGSAALTFDAGAQITVFGPADF